LSKILDKDPTYNKKYSSYALHKNKIQILRTPFVVLYFNEQKIHNQKLVLKATEDTWRNREYTQFTPILKHIILTVDDGWNPSVHDHTNISLLQLMMAGTHLFMTNPIMIVL